MYNSTYLLPSGQWQTTALFNTKGEALFNARFHAKGDAPVAVWPSVDTKYNIIAENILDVIAMLYNKKKHMANTHIKDSHELKPDFVMELSHAIKSFLDVLEYEY